VKKAPLAENPAQAELERDTLDQICVSAGAPFIPHLEKSEMWRTRPDAIAAKTLGIPCHYAVLIARWAILSHAVHGKFGRSTHSCTGWRIW
jgi:hypothetical protein